MRGCMTGWMSTLPVRSLGRALASLEPPDLGSWAVPSKDTGSPMQVQCGDARLMSEAVNKVKKGAVLWAEPNIAARRGAHEYLECCD